MSRRGGQRKSRPPGTSPVNRCMLASHKAPPTISAADTPRAAAMAIARVGDIRRERSVDFRGEKQSHQVDRATIPTAKDVKRMALVSMLLRGAYVKAGDSNTHLAGRTEGDTWGLRIETLCDRELVGSCLGKCLQSALVGSREDTEIGD